MAWSSVASSVGLSSPIMILNREWSERIFIESSFSPGSKAVDRSKGLMRTSVLNPKLIYSPPTAWQRTWYSFSGSIMIISVPNMK